MGKIKPVIAAVAVTIGILGAGTAVAETVYYKDTAVSWDHGRTWGGWSYSHVNSGYYEHRATANTTTSGWEKPSVVAKASQFVGFSTATAYWDCRG